MGAQVSVTKINFEDMKYALEHEGYLLINTLPSSEQECLIDGTIHADDETATLNKFLRQNITVKIIVYGLNASDERVDAKCQQLRSLGFFHVYAYMGGMFEWLLLQDIYGNDIFKTTSNQLDHLKYKGKKSFGVLSIAN
jgi:hypothetical protein